MSWVDVFPPDKFGRSLKLKLRGTNSVYGPRFDFDLREECTDDWFEKYSCNPLAVVIASVALVVATVIVAVGAVVVNTVVVVATVVVGGV